MFMLFAWFFNVLRNQVGKNELYLMLNKKKKQMVNCSDRFIFVWSYISAQHIQESQKSTVN